MTADTTLAPARARLRAVRLARQKTPEDAGTALAEAVTCGDMAKAAAGRGDWKRALAMCRQIARLLRLFPQDRLLAAALADAVLHAWPLARRRPGRVRQLLDLLDVAVESHPHDLDLAFTMHEAIASLVADVQGGEGQRHRALARLGLSWLRPLCERFPGEEVFRQTLETLQTAARNG